MENLVEKIGRCSADRVWARGRYIAPKETIAKV